MANALTEDSTAGAGQPHAARGPDRESLRSRFSAESTVEQNVEHCSIERRPDVFGRLPRVAARCKPVVYVDGALIESVADAPSLRPGVNALGVTYDLARDPAAAPLMTAVQSASGKTVNRMLHIDESSGDLLNKLEAVRLLCQETGCAQRYLAHDALNAIGQVSARIDDALGTRERVPRFAAYLQRCRTKTWPSASP